VAAAAANQTRVRPGLGTEQQGGELPGANCNGQGSGRSTAERTGGPYGAELDRAWRRSNSTSQGRKRPAVSLGRPRARAGRENGAAFPPFSQRWRFRGRDDPESAAVDCACRVTGRQAWREPGRVFETRSSRARPGGTGSVRARLKEKGLGGRRRGRELRPSTAAGGPELVRPGTGADSVMFRRTGRGRRCYLTKVLPLNAGPGRSGGRAGLRTSQPSFDKARPTTPSRSKAEDGPRARRGLRV